MPVAALYRVSTVKQSKKQRQSTRCEDDIPLQAAVVRDFLAQRPDWVLVREYTEKLSAFKVPSRERDVIRQVLADALAGKFRVLLVFKSDRLSRLSFEYPLILHQLHQAGVTVVAVAEGGRVLEMKDQYDKLVRFIEGWQSETESVNTSIRVSEHMRELAKQGRWSGGRPPYGFRLSDSRRGLPLEIDEGEAAVVREMVRLYLEEGLGSKRIANRLHESGHRTREGRLWTDSRVRQVLQNPIIAGLPAYERTRKNPNGSRSRVSGLSDLSNFIVPRDEHGNPRPVPEYAIIDLDTWYRLIERMRRNCAGGSPHPRSMVSGALLTGFLVCGYCGRSFISSKHNVTRKNGTVYQKRVYRCVTRARVGGGSGLCSGQGSYSQTKVDTVVLRELETFLSTLDPDELARHIEQRHVDSLAAAAERLKALDTEMRRVRRVLSAWAERLDTYFAAPENSLYSEEFLARKVREHQDTLARLEAERDALRRSASAAKQQKQDLYRFSRRAREWFKLFLDAPVQKKKAMLAQIVEKIVLYRDRVEIHYSVDLASFLDESRQAEKSSFRLQVLASL